MKQSKTSSHHRLLIEITFIVSFVLGILAPFSDPAPAKAVMISSRSQGSELLVRRHDHVKPPPRSGRK
jgi:hypothetical protein